MMRRGRSTSISRGVQRRPHQAGSGRAGYAGIDRERANSGGD